MADVAHAKSVHSAIAASSARAASGEGALGELIRQTQDTDQQIAALSDMLKADTRYPAPISRTRRRSGTAAQGWVGKLKTARAELRKEIERQFPQYAQLINPKPVGIAEARAKLKPGDALIVTYFSEGRGYVWAIPARGGRFGAIGMNRINDTVAAVDTLLKSVNSNAAGVEDIQPFDVGLAHELYAALLRPVEAGWKDAKEIIVVPHGALGRLPFSLLVTSNVAQPIEQQAKGMFAGYREIPILIKAKAVSHLPSVSALMSLRSMQAGSPSRKPYRLWRSAVFHRAGAAGASAGDGSSCDAWRTGAEVAIVAQYRRDDERRIGAAAAATGHGGGSSGNRARARRRSGQRRHPRRESERGQCADHEAR